MDPASPAPPARVSPALRKTLEVGALCNNASATRKEDGVFVGLATDVTLLYVLFLFAIPDPRQLRKPPNCTMPQPVSTHSPDELWRLAAQQHGVQGVPHQRHHRRAPPAVQVLLRRRGLDARPRREDVLHNRQQAQATAAHGLRVLAMAYSYGSIEPATSTHTTPPRRPARRLPPPV